MEPSLKVPHMESQASIEIDFKNCIICQEKKFPKAKFQLYNASKEGVERIASCAKYRESLGGSSYPKEAINRLKLLQEDENRPEMFWHRSCYSNFTNQTSLNRLQKRKRELDPDEENVENEQDRKKRRSSTSPLEWSKCMFCQGDSKDLNQVLTKETSDLIIERAPADPVMSVRLAGITDLIAYEGKYHLKCYSKFKRSTLRNSSKGIEDPQEQCFQEIIDFLEASLSEGNVYSLKYVWECYSQKLKSAYNMEPTIYRGDRFKERIMQHIGDKVSFIQPLNPRESPMIIPSNLGQCVVHSLLQNPQLMRNENVLSQEFPNAPIDYDEEILSWLFRVSLKINNDIRESKSLTSLGDINAETAEQIVPESLYMLIRLLCHGNLDGSLDESQDECDLVLKNKILSVCQDILFIASKGRKLTPKHVGLGLTIHQATRSKELVQLLHSAGHTISYDTLLRLDKAIANDVLQKYHENGNIFLPSNFKVCEDEESDYMRYAVDNIDINEETLSGLGTFHATQLAALKSTTDEEEQNYTIDIDTRRSGNLDIPCDLHDLNQASMTTDKPEPVFENQVETKWYQPNPALVEEAFRKDLLWVLSRLHKEVPQLQQVPGWSGFNQVFDNSNQNRTLVGPLPIINATAHEFDTLWTVIVRCLAMTKLIQGKFTVLTLDEALYCKAKMLQWSRGEECKSLVLMLGGFHTQMAFFKVIGKFMQSSGLSDIWSESGVLGENTSLNVLQGKVWNRVIRIHKLTYEALWRLFWPVFLKWSEEEGKSLDNTIPFHAQRLGCAVSERNHDIAENELDLLMNKVTQVTEALKEFDSSHSEFATLQYWRKYMELVSILLRFTRALREGDWQLFLSSFAEMLPWFAAFDHVNYTRWGIIFLADMQQLSQTAPEVYNGFTKGDFVTKESKNKFNRVSDDQALEHVNKSGKVAGGLVGITRNDATRDRWCLTYNDRARLANDTKAMFDIKQQEENDHKDSSNSRICRDEEDIQKLMATFQKYDVFRRVKELVSITTGDISTEEIKDDLLGAKDKGTLAVETFVQSRLIKKEEKFHSPIHQQKIKTLESLYTVPVTLDKAKTVSLKADRDLFRRLIVALESGREIEIDTLLQQELAPVPLSLATLDGKLRFSASKADLSHILQKEAEQNNLPINKDRTCTVIDGMAAIQSNGNRCGAKTFGEWCDNFLKFILSWFSNQCTRVDVVFDRYQENSIKEGTRDKRKGSKSRGIRCNVECRQQKIGNWERFLSLDNNKASLVNFLCTEISQGFQDDPDKELVLSGGFNDAKRVWSSRVKDVAHLSSTQEEADTRMLLHARDATNDGYQQVNVISCDTDVLVLLTAHYPCLCPVVWMFAGTAKKRSYVAIHKIAISDAKRRSLLAFHALSGCDTTSQFAGIGKTSAWKIYDCYPDMLLGLGENRELTENVLSSIETFVCKLHDKGTDHNSIDELRAKMFRSKANLDCMPPTQDALYLHVKRSHLQTFIWKRALEPCPELPEADGNGWIKEDKVLKPQLMTKKPVSSTCLQIAFCGCSKEGSLCATRRCTCVRLNLPCSRACKCDGKCRNLGKQE